MLLTQNADIFVCNCVGKKGRDRPGDAEPSDHMQTMATNVLPPLSIGNTTTFQGFTAAATTEKARVHSPSSSLSKGRSGTRVHRVGGKGEGRGGRYGSGEVTAKERGQKKSLIRDIDPARFVLVLDLFYF